MDSNINSTVRQGNAFVTELEYATFCVQMILGATGILGNALVCVTIARAKFMHNVTNFLIAHMAVVDMLVCVSLVIFQERYTEDNTRRDAANREIICKFFHGKRILWLFCNLSILSMVCVSVERYLGIVHPLKYPCLVTKTRVGVMIAAVWSIATTVKLPYITAQSFDSDAGQCFMSGLSSKSYALYCLLTVLEFYVPVTILLWCYGKIMISLRRSAESQRCENNPAPANELLAARRRIIKVLLIALSLYFAIWLPVHVFFMVVLFHPNLSVTAYTFLNVLQPTLAAANSVVNPFVYAFKYKEFQRGVCYYVFPFRCRKRRVAATVSTEMAR